MAILLLQYQRLRPSYAQQVHEEGRDEPQLYKTHTFQQEDADTQHEPLARTQPIFSQYYTYL